MTSIQRSPSSVNKPIRPVPGIRAAARPALTFQGTKQSQTSSSHGHSFWQTVSGWAKRGWQALQSFLNWLGSWLPSATFGKAAQTKAAIPIAPVSHVDPKLKADPLERDRIAFQIVDETWPQIADLYANRPPSVMEDGYPVFWKQQAERLLNQAAQKHLHTNAKLELELADHISIGVGEFTHPRSVSGPGSERASLGKVHLFPPREGYRYDMTDPAARQALYGTYLHEVRHMVQSYVYGFVSEGSEPAIPKPLKTDPVKHLYTKHLSCSEHSKGSVLKNALARENPHLKPLPDDGEGLLTVPLEDIQPYWEPMRRYWERTDYPLLKQMIPEYQAELKTLLQQGEPKLLEQYMHRAVIEELESYMTTAKRAPGIPVDQLQPDDLLGFSKAMLLRDLLRYYYEVRKIPKAQQHPLAAVRPLQLIA